MTCEPAWFAGADALHMPAYSLIGEPLGPAGRRAAELARAAGAIVSLDLASIGPLLAAGRRAARALIEAVAPDLLFATASEAEALLGRYAVEGLLELAPIAVVKRGAKGATVLARDGAERLRFEVATDASDRGRHDRRRRRLRCRVPRGLVRAPGRRAAPSRRHSSAARSPGTGPRLDSSPSPRPELPLG